MEGRRQTDKQTNGPRHGRRESEEENEGGIKRAEGNRITGKETKRWRMNQIYYKHMCIPSLVSCPSETASAVKL